MMWLIQLNPSISTTHPLKYILLPKKLQSVRAENRWNDFAFELEALNYDILFCIETWREERESGGDGHRGVVICISLSFFKRIQNSIHFHAYCSRIGCLHIDIVDVKFVAIVCYMPTSWDTDGAVEEVYSLLDMLIHNAERVNAITVLGGDFNASIGAPEAGDDLTLLGATPSSW